MEGALARAFSARATSQVLIGRWIGSHLPNGRSRWLMRGDSPCTPKRAYASRPATPSCFHRLSRSVYLSLSKPSP